MLKWQLSDKSVFYNNILAFFLSINGIPALFDKAYVDSIKPDDSINLKGKVTGDNCFKRVVLLEQTKAKLNSIPEALSILGQQLVISCYVSIEEQNDKSPEFEFFRHLRNGCAHGNKFNFRSYKDKTTGKIIYDEPCRTAKWKGLEITEKLQGQKVIFGFIGLGDILALLNETSGKIRNIN